MGPLGYNEGTHPTPMPQVRYVEDIYYDYLHDCYQANKHLTPEDWMWYGRELHHIEIPNCDGGILGPLNEQHLTTYQHWVAGVLQSEVMGRTCFAFVPRGVLPAWVESLRVKWVGEHNRKTAKVTDRPRAKIPYADRQPNPRSERISKVLGNPIILTTPQGQVIRYDSIKLACRIHSLHPGHLREVAQGKRKQHKGYTAQYLPT
jgi:hypothetical protein